MSRLQQDFLFDGRYRLRKKLGEGGFSEVWLVDDTSAKITLVLKVFLPSSQLDESGIEMFRQEFALVYNLNHPNLLKYTYYGVCVGHPYLVMPYYNSGSAEDLLGNCSERKAWQFLHDVSAGLACMHEHQPPIIHQDIKPANVLLDGNSYIITDFGISGKARSILGEGGEGQSTVQGTRPYMPPEKFRRVAELTMARYNLHVTKITKKDVFGPRQYGQRVFNVINRTFENLYGYSQMTQRQIDEYIKRYFNFLDFELLCLVEDWNTPDHDLVGVGITIPSLTKALQKCHNGRLFPFGWWHLIRALKFKKTDVVDCLLIGVLPEYRSKGANALLFYDLIPIYQKYGFLWGETHVEMETNGKVQSQWSYLENELHKRRRCYKKAL